MVNRVNNFVKKQVLDGRQAYIVAPLVEESEKLNINSAESLYMSFKNGVYKDFNVGLLHGKMKAREKEKK